MAATREAGFGAEAKRRIILGTYALSSGYYDAYYGQAQKVRTLISRDFDRAFDQVDVLVSPSTPVTAFRIGEKVDDPLAMYYNDLCTIPANLAGNAAASFPVGLAPEDGLPVGSAGDGAGAGRRPALPGRRRAGAGPGDRPGAGRCWTGSRSGGGPMTASTGSELTSALRRGARQLRPGARARGARRAEHRVEDVLRLLDGVRGGPEHPGLPGLPRPARLAAGGQRQGHRVGDPDRAGAELLDRGVVPVRPEELLLPGHAEELPDLPVRRADRLRRLDRGRGRRRDLPDRHRAGAHGGGHRQVAARRRRDRADPRRRPLAAGLQPVRSAADRDRDQADRGHRGQGPGGGAGVRRRCCGTCCGRWASPTSGWSRARCAATRTSRCGPSPDAPLGTRTETKNVNSLRSVERALSATRSPARRRCWPAGRGSRRRPGTGTRTPGRPRRGGARSGRRTTATSPNRTWCRSPRPGSGSRSCGRRCPSRPACA